MSHETTVRIEKTSVSVSEVNRGSSESYLRSKKPRCDDNALDSGYNSRGAITVNRDVMMTR